MPLTWIYLFVIGTIFDLLYVLWMNACNEKRAHLAGILGVLISACSFLGVKEALADALNLIPFWTGLYVGSYVGVKLKAK